MKRVLITTAVAAMAAAGLMASLTPSESTAQEAPAYVGTAACKACHFKQHRYWKKTDLAKSMESLAPTTAEAELAERVRGTAEAERLARGATGARAKAEESLPPLREALRPRSSE